MNTEVLLSWWFMTFLVAAAARHFDILVVVVVIPVHTSYPWYVSWHCVVKGVSSHPQSKGEKKVIEENAESYIRRRRRKATSIEV